MIITGIGSRKAPSDVLNFIKKLPLNDHIIRSGGADGCDSAFEYTSSNLEIYLPWSGFNGKVGMSMSSFPTHTVDLAEEIARMMHPTFKFLSQGAKKLHTRNVFQILGKNLLESEKSDMVICWTPDGANTIDTCKKTTGGTATAIKLACSFDIPVYNLYNHNDMDKIHTLFDLW